VLASAVGSSAAGLAALGALQPMVPVLPGQLHAKMRCSSSSEPIDDEFFLRSTSPPPSMENNAARMATNLVSYGILPYTERGATVTNCTFILNRLPTSSVVCNIGWFTAFSGDGVHRNNPDSANVPDNGPTPPGSYFIVDRESGGMFGTVRDWALSRDQWFALYRNDGVVDDATFVMNVRRGQFRLHPLGPRRMSTGCIVLYDQHQFDRLRAQLLQTPVRLVPGTSLRTYGTLEVATLAPDSVHPKPRSPGSPTPARIA
jgi:hypothetical protein